MLAVPAWAADHGDAPVISTIHRNDANITDLHLFVTGAEDNSAGNRLVLALSTNDTIPKTATSYQFPSDVTWKVQIDTHSEVSFADAAMNAKYGGTIVNPAGIYADITLQVNFDANGVPTVKTVGLDGDDGDDGMRFFAGLRDDPFIRGPRIGRNVGSMVFSLPLRRVVKAGHPTILAWASSSAPGISGTAADFAGRALRSMFAENAALNHFDNPGSAFVATGISPADANIYDTSRPAAFPNGRALTDDVVDLVGDHRLLVNDAPFPSTNDVPFLDQFPYLAPPHGAPADGYYLPGNDDDHDDADSANMSP